MWGEGCIDICNFGISIKNTRLRLKLALNSFYYIIYILVLALIVIFTIHRKIRLWKKYRQVTNRRRGAKSERKLVRMLIQLKVPTETIFHDLYVIKPNGKYSQIDLVIATTQGLIVFEVKEYSGWIFGNAGYTNWTQVLAGGKVKHHFFNPIKQNQGHIKALRNLSPQFSRLPIFSVIVFYGKCELKAIDYIPQDTFVTVPKKVKQVLRQIKKKNDPAKFSSKREVVKLLKAAVENGESPSIAPKHHAEIKELTGKERLFK